MLFSKDRTLNYFLVLISTVVFVYIAYFLQRSSFVLLLSLWLSLFAITHYFVQKSTISTRGLFIIGLIFRGALIIAIPPLSQDFNRFIWDGRLLLNGFNPYLTTPDFFIENNLAPINDAQILYNAMGNLNATNYTNYPPVSQLGYFVAALFGSKSILLSVVVMRLQLILADVGIYYYGKKILKLIGLPEKNIFLYFLNPFIVLELTGNLHYEPVMIFFLVSSLFFLLKEKWLVAAILFGFSINVKLLPLIFIPVFAGYFYNKTIIEKSFTYSVTSLFKDRKKWIPYFSFSAVSILTNLALFLPFYDSKLVANYTSSIGLWFGSFEFNASVYYVLRWIGYQLVGWNTIGTLGKILPLITVISIVLISVLKNNSKPKDLFKSLLFSVSGYLLFSTTVHPWYLSIPMALSVFTSYKYIYTWTITVVLSYYAYSNPSFKENFYLITIEYLLVILVLIYELKSNPKAVTEK